jgi:hypothetical protein
LPTKYILGLIAILVLVSALHLFCAAQQSTQTTSPDSSAQTPPPQEPEMTNPPSSPQQPPGENKNEKKTTSDISGPGTSNDRLFFTLPNFLTLENAGKVPPLTTKQKFAVVVRGSFDYVQLPWYAFLAGVSQASNSEPGYGQGWEGYGKRLGSAIADGTIENFMTGAILPSMLHQDPRYFQSGHGSFTHRTFYAISRNLITRGDSGKNQFNYSEVLGSAMSAAISTYSYHPQGQYVTTTTPGVLQYIPSERTLANTAKVWGTQYGYDTLMLVIKEFWPDIRRRVRKTPKSEPGISMQQQQT